MRIFNFLVSITVMMTVMSCENKAQEDVLDYLTVPDGFKIDIYANDVDGARSMVLGDKGTLFVGSRGTGMVYALVDENNDMVADKTYVIAQDLNSPNGVAFRNGSLYVAEISRILRFENIEERLDNPPNYTVVNDDFPSDTHHGWKYIAFGPDGKLYVPVGAPCNVCLSEDERYASLMRMNPDGSNLEVYAKGIRNTVGFDWHPETGVLWFTDNGRDWMGENKPPDELNRAPAKGMHFGFPHCHGDIRDSQYGVGHSCDEFTSPVQKLDPHVAALGMHFYKGEMFPAEYKHQVFIAEHGSWNRMTPIGYRVTLVRLNGTNATSYETFAEGWLQKGGKLGRPVDVIELPDGSLLVSDDYGDRIFRISYSQ